MHILGAHLDLEGTAIVGYNHRMQRLITIGFGTRNVVIKFFRNRCPDVMHDTEHRIAALDVIHDDPKCTHVVQSRKIERLTLHLAPDTVDMLRPAEHFGANAGACHLSFEAGNSRIHKTLALDPPFF